MDLTSGLKIATIRGIAIRVHWSWALIFSLLTWSLAGYFEGQFEDWSRATAVGAGAITAFTFFLSVLLHELSHALVAQRYGMQVPSITLFIFGGVSSIASEMKSARQEFFVAAAGPAMSFLLGLVFGVAAILSSGHVAEILFYLGTTNVILGIFNLLPGFPLDGGRVFRAIIWGRTKDLAKSTRIASRVGVGIAWLMIAAGVVIAITVSLSGLWYIFIGFFLKQGAEAAQQQLILERALEGVRARDLMRPPPDPLPESSSIQSVVDIGVLARGERVILLEREGRVTGLMTTTDLARVPREEWPATSARTVMVQTEAVATVAPGAPAVDAVKLMAERDIHQVPVIEDGQLVGILSRGDVLNHIQNRVQFGGGRPASPERR